MMTFATAAVRGCGVRVKGAVYAETAMAPDGLPVEAFLMDPPRPVPVGLAVPVRGVTTIDMERVTHIVDRVRGVTTIDMERVTHIVDRVGTQHYPNVADVIEEVRLFGLSRRIPQSFPFEKLSPRSHILLVHDRALVEPMGEYRPTDEAPHTCPKHRPEHVAGGSVACVGVVWQDLDPGTVTVDEATGVATRELASFAYTGHVRPAGVEPVYTPGIFASFPVGRLAIVRDPTDPDREAAALRAASKAGTVRVHLVDQ